MRPRRRQAEPGAAPAACPTPPREAESTDWGMSERTVDALASWYEQTFYERRDEPEIEASLARELRHRLRDEHGVLPEFIGIEVERVNDRIFRAAAPWRERMS